MPADGVSSIIFRKGLDLKHAVAGVLAERALRLAATRAAEAGRR